MKSLLLQRARCVVVVAMLSIAAPAASRNRPGFEHVGPVIDAEVMAVVVSDLALSPAQTTEVNALHATYFASVKQLEADIGGKIEALTMWARSFEKGTPEREMASQEFGEKVWPLTRRGFDDSQALLEAFYAETEKHLDQGQRDKMPAVRRTVRRLNFFSGKMMDLTSRAQFHGYFDMHTLVNDAAKPGQELSSIVGLPAAELAEPHATARAKIEQAMTDYELALDELLVKLEGFRRTSGVQQRERQQWWCGIFKATDDAAKAVALELSTAGEQKGARTWELRYWRQWLPQGFQDLPISNISQWLKTSAILMSPEQTEAFAAIEQEYAAKLHELRRRIFDTATTAQCKHGGLHGEETEHLHYVKAILDLVDMHDRTVKRVAALFDTATAARIREEFPANDARKALTGSITLHLQFELGLLDPETFVVWDNNRKLRPVRNPETGRWEMQDSGETYPDR